MLPEWGRRGIGGRLVVEVLAWADRNDRERVTLTTFADVVWNGPFYEQLGFATLDPADWTHALRETWERERSMGLPMDQRVVMAAPTP